MAGGQMAVWTRDNNKVEKISLKEAKRTVERLGLPMPTFRLHAHSKAVLEKEARVAARAAEKAAEAEQQRVQRAQLLAEEEAEAAVKG